MRLHPDKLVLACAVPKKGYDILVINRIVRFLKDMGLVHFAYRCDREVALNSLIEEACARTGRTGFHGKADGPPKDTIPCRGR